MFCRYLTDPGYRFRVNSRLGSYNRMPDKEYLERLYFVTMGRVLNIDSPTTFNEKLQWLKLYDRRPEYTMMVDKYLVRAYIAKVLGEEYLIPLLGVWDDPDEIDFDALPDQFALKCNHNSGLGMCICRDKSKLDIKQVKKNLRRGLMQDYYLTGREWPYKDVPRKIICEKYMTIDQKADMEGTPKGLIDYKFYCFHGEPLYLSVSRGMEDHTTARMSFLTLDWKIADFCRSDYKPFLELPEKPSQLNEMIEIAKKLSAGTYFLRVDLYEIGGRVYFGELTFSPGAGMMRFAPPEADICVGSKLKLEIYEGTP